MLESKQHADNLIRNIKNGEYDDSEIWKEFMTSVNKQKDEGKLTEEDAKRVRLAKANREAKVSGSV